MFTDKIEAGEIDFKTRRRRTGHYDTLCQTPESALSPMSIALGLLRPQKVHWKGPTLQRTCHWIYYLHLSRKDGAGAILAGPGRRSEDSTLRRNPFANRQLWDERHGQSFKIGERGHYSAIAVSRSWRLKPRVHSKGCVNNRSALCAPGPAKSVENGHRGSC